MNNTPPILLTDQAANKIFEFLEEEGHFDLHFRAFITGGGCKGLQYQFMFDINPPQDNDFVILHPIRQEIPGHIPLLVDDVSINYLKGAIIDYEENIDGHFDFHFRAFVIGGYYKGLQYQFMFDTNAPQDNDFVILHPIRQEAPDHIRLLVDDVSMNYLKGATIDYEENIDGEHFIIRNLKATHFCSCGLSFAMEQTATE